VEGNEQKKKGGQGLCQRGRNGGEEEGLLVGRPSMYVNRTIIIAIVAVVVGCNAELPRLNICIRWMAFSSTWPRIGRGWGSSVPPADLGSGPPRGPSTAHSDVAVRCERFSTHYRVII
jgi:hypothetical protein